MSTVPVTNGERSLGDADESEEASSGILMWKEAGVLLGTQVGILKFPESCQ